MDELDLFKEKWQTREQELPKLSYTEIYKMLLKKSSSIVKWIFIISILELLFWVGLALIMPESQMQLMEDMGLKNFAIWSNVIHIAIVFVFIYSFYKNYRTIQVTDSTKNLMQNILKTRKTVRYFVYYNIGMFLLSSIIMIVFYYLNINQLYEVLNMSDQGIARENFQTAFILIQIAVVVIFVGLLMLFYYLIYGILLRRLKQNYTELKRMEV
ncbi:MAG: hypothetical protein ACI86C_000765 [Candidatus Latescibacterota bacterium]|jgi:hypothetical protein